ncbi:MAG: hypothetical protein AMXMBFR7_52610 [Planctomycetota bacterium]
MTRRKRRGSAQLVTHCPHCGNDKNFALYVATLRVHHVSQATPGRWHHEMTEPRTFDAKLSFLIVCERCAHPLGPPPDSLLKSMP